MQSDNSLPQLYKQPGLPSVEVVAQHDLMLPPTSSTSTVKFGLGILGLRGAAQLAAIYVGKEFDGYKVSRIEMDAEGVVYFYRTDKDGKPMKVSHKVGEVTIEADAACIHASKLGSFLLDDEAEQPARPVQQQQGQQQRR